MQTQATQHNARWAELKHLVRLAWPVVVGQVGIMMMNLVDVLMVGRHGEDALASFGLGSTWAFMGLIFGLGTALGLDPLVAQARGAGDHAAYNRALRTGAVLLTVLSGFIMAQHFTVHAALTFLAQPVELLPLAVDYTKVLALGVWPMLIFLVVRQAIQARGLMRPAMWVVLAANVINVAGNTVLMNGVGGWEGLGPIGAGWSTSLVRWGMLFLLLLGMPQERRALCSGWDEFTQQHLRTVAGIAMPVGVISSLEVWGFSSTTLIMGWLGSSAVAAHTVALNLSSIAYMVPLGMSAAASARVGNLIGARLPWHGAAWVAIGAGATATAGFAYMFVAFPATLVQLYLPDSPEATAVAASLLPFAAAYQVFDGTQTVTIGVLRGAGDTRFPAIAVLVSYYLLGLPLGAWLALHGGWGPQGVWIGLIVALISVAVMVLARLRYVMARGPTRVSV